MHTRLFLVVLYLISFTCSLWLGLQISPGELTWQMGTPLAVNAQSPQASQLVQQGIERYQAVDLRGAIERWQKALDIYQQNNNRANAVIVGENLARAYQQLGQPEQAIGYWNQVIADYRQFGNLQLLGRSLTEQAQAYSSLGQPKQAIALLCSPDKDGNCSNGSALQIARATSDITGEVAARGSLGDATRLMGDYESAIKNLETSLELARKLKNPAMLLSVLNSLGNAEISQVLVKYRQANSAVQRGDSLEAEKRRSQAQQEDALALSYLRESREIARSRKDVQSEMRSPKALALPSLLVMIPLYHRNNATGEAANSLQQATHLLENRHSSFKSARCAGTCTGCKSSCYC